MSRGGLSPHPLNSAWHAVAGILVSRSTLVKGRNILYDRIMPMTGRAHWGRPFNTDTKLGKLMWDQGLAKHTVCGYVGIADRTLTEILAGRMALQPRYIQPLCRLLECDPEDIIED